MSIDVWSIIKVILMPLAVLYIGFNERDKKVMKKEMVDLKEELHDIDTNLQVIKAENISTHHELKKGVDRVEEKIDKLLDKLVNKGL